MQFRSKAATPTRLRGARGFTLVELLIVITVIGLLTAIIAVVASRSVDRQKQAVTQQIMSNVILAIDQFEGENKLRSIYDQRNAATFGAYPPYQLARPSNNARATCQLVEPVSAQPGGATGALKDRLARDVIRNPGSANDTSRINLGTDAIAGLHDDNRALYAYLRYFAPKALAQIPDNAIKPLTSTDEFLNPGSNAGSEDSRIEVLGIHDGWGVPLDYMLYVKLEWGQIVDAGGNVTTGVKVVDRMPVLVSRGVSAEVFAAQVSAYQSTSNPASFDKSKMIYSPAFPALAATVDADGVFTTTDSRGNGWVRARAVGDFFGYVPAQDP